MTVNWGSGDSLHSFDLSCSCDVELLQEVVHDEDGHNDRDENGAGEANDEDGANDVVQLTAEHSQVHGNGHVHDIQVFGESVQYPAQRGGVEEVHG